jgi:FAD/FMN-containing dehydrogenase
MVPQPFSNLSRRSLLLQASLAAAGLAMPAFSRVHQAASIVNDITGLNPVRVARLVRPRDSEEVRRLLADWRGPVSVGGGCFSMGGQIAEEASLHLDMRDMNRVVAFDPVARIVRVQTGARWRDIQSAIDPHDLSVKIMQSYSDFTVGGALSVNCHGRYVGAGPLVNSVRRITLALAGGQMVEASRERHPELFHAAIGGYGGLGVITEAELDLVPNVRMAREVFDVPLADYPGFFRDRVKGRSQALLHNADIDPADFDRATAITWVHTDRPLTVPERLYQAGDSYALDRTKVWALARLPGAHLLRRTLVDPLDHAAAPVVWRNHEASLSLRSLGPISSTTATCALQEYFIPVAHFLEFADRMAKVLRDARVNALNVSIRQAPADPGTVLAWARQEVFSFVLYYQQAVTMRAVAEVGNWTRQLIDAALALGGSYYLPYQLHATRAQFQQAYPGVRRFASLKAEVDPRGQFRNRLWDKYLAT